MQTIIIPVDFTARSRKAIDFVAMLYQTTSVRFILLHAYSTLKSNEFLISIDDIIENDIQRKLETEGEYLKEKCESDKIELIYLCDRNDIISSILNATKKFSADMVVVGSDGEESWNDISLREEGKTINIVKKAPIPALIVPLSHAVLKPNNILFATVINGIYGNEEVEPLIDMVKAWGAHIDILNVGSERASVSGLNKGLESTVNGYFYGIDFKLHAVLNADTFQAIDQFSAEHQIDLICIMYRKHSVLEKLLRSGITKKIFTQIGKPILALKHSR